MGAGLGRGTGSGGCTLSVSCQLRMRGFEGLSSVCDCGFGPLRRSLGVWSAPPPARVRRSVRGCSQPRLRSHMWQDGRGSFRAWTDSLSRAALWGRSLGWRTGPHRHAPCVPARGPQQTGMSVLAATCPSGLRHLRLGPGARLRAKARSP